MDLQPMRIIKTIMRDISELHLSPQDTDHIRLIIQRHLRQEKIQHAEEIIRDAVCDVFQEKPIDVMKNNRRHEYLYPRNCMAYIMRYEYGVHWSKIAKMIGVNGRHHTSAMNAANRWRDLVEMEDYPAFITAQCLKEVRYRMLRAL